MKAVIPKQERDNAKKALEARDKVPPSRKAGTAVGFAWTTNILISLAVFLLSISYASFLSIFLINQIVDIGPGLTPHISKNMGRNSAIGRHEIGSVFLH